MNQKLLISSSFNEGYRFWPGFLESLRKCAPADMYRCVAIGTWHREIPHDCVHLPDVPNLFGRPVIQHGAFLDVLKSEGGVDDHSIVLFVDADAKFQRPFTGEELNHITSVGVNHYLVGPNRIHDRVELWGDEAPRVLPTREYNFQYHGQFDKVPVFNTGFLAMNVGTWVTVYHRTLNFIASYGHWFQHHAATQLFLCAAMWELGLRPLLAPLDMACHGHCGTPPGLKIIEDEAYIAKTTEGGVTLNKVAYAHMLCGI